MDDSQKGDMNNQYTVNEILIKAVQFYKKGLFQQSELVITKGLELYPGRKEFLALRTKIKQQITKQQITKQEVESLETEALLLMQSGEEDAAQLRFRKIHELDPTKKGYQHSTQKTGSEKKEEWMNRYEKLETMKIYLYGFLALLVLIISITVYATLDNRSHLKKARKFINTKRYEKAKYELAYCGWVFATKEKELLKKQIKAIADEAWHEATALKEAGDYLNAISVLEKNLEAADDPNTFNDQVDDCQQLHTLRLERKEAALESRDECRNANVSAKNNNAETDALGLWHQAVKLESSATAMMESKKYQEADNLWSKAAEKYKEATAKTVEVKQKRIEISLKRAEAIKVREDCIKTMVSSKRLNAHIEAAEFYLEAQNIMADAEDYFKTDDFVNARTEWNKAKGKFEQAMAKVYDSPLYKKANIIFKRWGKLATGLSEDEVRKKLGLPKHTHEGSDECFWYYQCQPEVVLNNSGEKTCILPNCGYVRFVPVSVETILGRMKKAYLDKVEKELEGFKRADQMSQNRHRKKIKKIKDSYYDYSRDREYDITEEISSHEESVTIALEKHEVTLQRYKEKYDKKVDSLINGLVVRKPVHVLADWVEPDLTDIASLLDKQKKIKDPNVTIRRERWQIKSNWKKLEFNFNETQVNKILGSSDRVDVNPQKKTAYYGDVPGYGIVVFTPSRDSTLRLSYWKGLF